MTSFVRSGEESAMLVSTAKRKVSMSLDADLVEVLERDGALSSQVNELLRVEVRRRQHGHALQQLIDRLVEEHGPLDTDADLEAIDRYKEMLS